MKLPSRDAVRMPSTAALSPGRGGQPRVLIDAPAGAGEIYLHGAHLTSWVPRGGREVIFTSRNATFDGRAAIRGGIPLCLPWFGRGISGDRTPSHGWGRTMTWNLLCVESVKNGRVRVVLTARHEGIDAIYEVVIAESLEVAVTLTSVCEEPVVVETALHTYLAVHDVTASRIEGLQGARYDCKVTQRDGLVQNGPVTIGGPVDRIYYSDAPLRVTDPGNGRVMTITKTGSANTVVWNPWVEGAKAFADMADDEFASMLCVETASILDNAVTLEFGQSWTIGFKLDVEAL